MFIHACIKLLIFHVSTLEKKLYNRYSLEERRGRKVHRCKSSAKKNRPPDYEICRESERTSIYDHGPDRKPIRDLKKKSRL